MWATVLTFLKKMSEHKEWLGALLLAFLFSLTVSIAMTYYFKYNRLKESTALLEQALASDQKAIEGFQAIIAKSEAVIKDISLKIEESQRRIDEIKSASTTNEISGQGALSEMSQRQRRLQLELAQKNEEAKALMELDASIKKAQDDLSRNRISTIQQVYREVQP